MFCGEKNRSFLEREVDSVLASWLSGLEYNLLLTVFGWADTNPDLLISRH